MSSEVQRSILPIPEVNRLANAFYAGAKDVNKDVKCKVSVIGSFFDPPKAKETAFAMIENGADMMYAERFGVSEKMTVVTGGGAESLLMLADGNGEFTRALGLELDATSFGMGHRSQRFALIAEDGVVTGLFVEGPGEFRVSSAEHVLSQL